MTGCVGPMPPAGNDRGSWEAMEKWHNNTMLNNSIWALDTGDVNGDGFADIVAVGENHTLAVFLNNQSYGFTKHFVDIDNNKNYTRVALGDVDGDNDLDIMVLTWPNPVQDPTPLDLYLYTNGGQGNFNGGGGVHKVDVGGGVTYGFLFSLSLKSGDFNNDGKADFVLGFTHKHPNHMGEGNPARATFFFLLNDGVGGYASTSTTTDASNNQWGVLWIGNIQAKEATADNFEDVVVSLYGYDSYQATIRPGDVKVYKGGVAGIVLNPFWTFVYSAGNNMNEEWTASVEVGEFTGDNNPDILISTDAQNQQGDWEDGKIWLANGQGAQGYANPAAKVTVANQGMGFSLNTHNFDELNQDDFVVGYNWDTNADGEIDKWELRIYTTAGQGAFAQNPKWSANTGPQGGLEGTVSTIFADDFDNSGAGDILYVGKDLRLIDIRTGFEADIEAPDAISNLAATQLPGSNPDIVHLEWTAPGDDGDSGGAAGYYVLHYGKIAIDDSNFNQTTNFTDAPEPAEPGNAEFTNIDELDSDTLYYFAIRTVDDAGNWAPLSNVAHFKIPDYEVPGTIDDLSAEYIADDGEIELTWSAPGDDGDEGNASIYHVAFSDSDIADFTTATEITSGVPAPQAAAATETMRIDINSTNGMEYDDTYYFAVIAEDDNANLGSLSNVDSVVLPDIAPPAAVVLSAEPGEDDGEVDLSWEAPGDDGGEGTAGSYEIRFATDVITEESFDDAQLATGVPGPQTAGTGEEHTVTGLTGGETYYFVLRSYDDAMNPSPLSNPASATATDVTPPAKLTGVELTDTPGDNGGSLTFSWEISTAADFGAYRVYVSTSKMTEADEDDLATEITDVNTTVYNITSMTRSFLENGKDYYACVLAVDISGNEGPISTSLKASPEDDLGPQLLYFAPQKASLKLETGSIQRFNVTVDFAGDDTTNIMWYVDDEAEGGVSSTRFDYDVPEEIGDTHTIKVELDDGTSKVEHEWSIEVVGVGEGDVGDDDDDDSDDDSDDDTDDDSDDDTDDDSDDDTDDDSDDDSDDEDFWSNVVDLDKDDLDDRWEKKYGIDDPDADPDKDGYTNLEEYNKRTDPKKRNPGGNTGGSGGDSDAEKGALEENLLWIIVGIAAFFFVLLIIVLVIVIVVKSGRKKESDDEEFAEPKPVVISSLEDVDEHGRVSEPESGTPSPRIIDSNLHGDGGVSDLHGDEDEVMMESFFSSGDEETHAALPPVSEIYPPEALGIMDGLRNSSMTSPGFDDLSRDILPQTTSDDETTLSLESLFAPIFDDEGLSDDELHEERDDDDEIVAELLPASGGSEMENYLDELLMLTPTEERDEKTLRPDRSSSLLDEEDSSETSGALVEVECYNCGTSIPIFTEDRPLIITCPQCGIQGEIE